MLFLFCVMPNSRHSKHVNLFYILWQINAFINTYLSVLLINGHVLKFVPSFWYIPVFFSITNFLLQVCWSGFSGYNCKHHSVSLCFLVVRQCHVVKRNRDVRMYHALLVVKRCQCSQNHQQFHFPSFMWHTHKRYLGLDQVTCFKHCRVQPSISDKQHLYDPLGWRYKLLTFLVGPRWCKAQDSAHRFLRSVPDLQRPCRRAFCLGRLSCGSL